MVELTDILLACASFGPALLLMFLTLRDYTFPRVEKPFFDDPKLFMLFTLGIVLGMVFFFIDTAITFTVMTIIFVAMGVPILQSFIKLSILNYPKFQRKVDTAFYGLALGLGISTTYAFSRMYSVVHDPSTMGLGGVDAVSMTLIIMMGVQIVLIQGSTSALIAVGCARGQPWSYFAYSLMYALGYSALLYGSAVAADVVGDYAAIGVILAAWLVSAYSYWHVYVIDFPNLIDDAKRGLKGAKKVKKTS
jgi:hypothetical protein